MSKVQYSISLLAAVLLMSALFAADEKNHMPAQGEEIPVAALSDVFGN